MDIPNIQRRYLGIKFFDMQEHMEQFAKGLIYFSTTGSLNLGNNSEMNYNEYEIPVFNIPVTINDIELPCKSYTLSYNWQKMIPLFCYYRLDDTNTNDYGNAIKIQIPNKFSENGLKKFAAIFELSDFMNRLDLSCQHKCGYKHVNIQYIDYSKQDNSWAKIVSSNLYGFLEIHDIKHSYQNESRIILTEIFVNEPMQLDLGKWRNKPLLLQHYSDGWHFIKNLF